MRKQIGCWGLLGVLMVCGCGSNSGTVPVSGVVQVKGKPVGNANILFQPVSTDIKDPPPFSVAVTDQAGGFSLKTKAGDNGAIPGEHRVSVYVPIEGQTEEDLQKEGAREVREYHSTFTVPAEGTSDAKIEF